MTFLFLKAAAEKTREAEIAAAVAKALADTAAAAEKASAQKVCAQILKHGGRKAATISNPEGSVVAFDSYYSADVSVFAGCRENGCGGEGCGRHRYEGQGCRGKGLWPVPVTMCKDVCAHPETRRAEEFRGVP